MRSSQKYAAIAAFALVVLIQVWQVSAEKHGGSAVALSPEEINEQLQVHHLTDIGL